MSNKLDRIAARRLLDSCQGYGFQVMESEEPFGDGQFTEWFQLGAEALGLAPSGLAKLLGTSTREAERYLAGELPRKGRRPVLRKLIGAVRTALHTEEIKDSIDQATAAYASHFEQAIIRSRYRDEIDDFVDNDPLWDLLGEPPH